MTIRAWLRRNGYVAIADQIDEVTLEWRSQGKHTRRNWWDILAGRGDGTPITVAARTFPVLKAAQKRQGRPISKNAISRRGRKRPPGIRPGRYRGDRRT